MQNRAVLIGAGVVAAGLLIWAAGPDGRAPDVALTRRLAPAAAAPLAAGPPVEHREPERHDHAHAPERVPARPRGRRPRGLVARRMALYEQINSGRAIDEEMLERLLRVVRDSADTPSRELAIWGLSKVPRIHRATAIAELIELLERHREGGIRIEALKALAQLRGPLAEQAVRAALAGDPDAGLRELAAVLLMDLFPETAATVEAVRQAAESDRVAEVRTRAIEALSGAGTLRATRALREVARGGATAGERALARHKLEELRLLRVARGSGPAAAAARRKLSRMLAAAPEQRVSPEETTAIVERHK